MFKWKNNVFRIVNKIFPKYNKVVVSGSNTIESNAVEVANYLSKTLDRKVSFLISKEYKPYLKPLVSDEVRLIKSGSFLAYLSLLTSKYIFSTHGSSLAGSANKQIEVNVWHGLLYKNIRKLREESPDFGLDAEVTVGTSPLSQKMFSEAFGVSKESVFISGYPRNDMMLRANENPGPIKEKIGEDILDYDKIVFWMPTYRRSEGVKVNGKLSLGNPFQVEGFNVESFNEILKQQNTLCLLKPHYYYLSGDFQFKHSNIKIIDDKWIAKRGVALYELLACTDILISDFSSVMYDYSLLNKPIICFSTDVENYKRTEGLYFDDIENWLPSKLIQSEEKFFEHLDLLLLATEDPYITKRKHVKNIAFTYDDANSMERLCTYVFNKYD